MAINLAHGKLLLVSLEGIVTITDTVGPGEKLLTLGRGRQLISIEGFDDVCSLILKAAKGGTLLCDDGLPRVMGDLILGAGGDSDVLDHGERLAPCTFVGRVF